MISAVLSIIPKNAVTHIQKIAPAPPTDSAVATPAMLPIPTVPASDVAAAWKGLMSWSFGRPTPGSGTSRPSVLRRM